MFALLAFGTIGFWLLVAIEIVLLFVFTENKNGGAGVLSLLVFGGLLQWVSGVDILGYVTENPLNIGALVVGYFFFGTAWATFKWWLFVVDKAQAGKERKAEFLISVKERGYDPEDQLSWDRNSIDNYDRMMKTLSVPPQISRYKERFFTWMGFWWTSIIWTICSDFVTRIVKSIYNRIASTLQSMSDHVWKSVSA